MSSPNRGEHHSAPIELPDTSSPINSHPAEIFNDRQPQVAEMEGSTLSLNFDSNNGLGLDFGTNAFEMAGDSSIGPSHSGGVMGLGSNTGFGSTTGIEIAGDSNRGPSHGLAAAGMGFGSATGFEMAGDSNTGPTHGAAAAGMGFGSTTGFEMAGDSNTGPSYGAAAAGMFNRPTYGGSNTGFELAGDRNTGPVNEKAAAATSHGSNTGFEMAGDSNTGPTHGAAAAGMSSGFELVGDRNNGPSYSSPSNEKAAAAYQYGSNTGFEMAGDSNNGPSHGAAAAGILGMSSQGFGLAGDSNNGPSHGAAAAGMSTSNIVPSNNMQAYPPTGLPMVTTAHYPSSTGKSADYTGGIGFGTDYSNQSSSGPSHIAPLSTAAYGSNTGLFLPPSQSSNHQHPAPNSILPAPAPLMLSPSHPSDALVSAAYPMNDYTPSPSLHRNPSAASSLHVEAAPIPHAEASRKIDHLAMPGSGLPLHTIPQSASAGSSSSAAVHAGSSAAGYVEPPPPYEPSDSHTRPNTSTTGVSRSASVNSTAPLNTSAALPLQNLSGDPERGNTAAQGRAYPAGTPNRPWSTTYWTNPSAGVGGRQKGWKKRKRYWICMAIVLFIVGISTGLAVSMSNKGSDPNKNSGSQGNSGSNGSQGTGGNTGNPASPWEKSVFGFS